MRDLSAHEKQEQQRAQKEMERLQSEITDVRRSKEKLNSHLEEYEAQMSELKEQVLIFVSVHSKLFCSQLQ